MRQSLFIFFFLLTCIFTSAQDETIEENKTAPEISDSVYYIQVRVIFSGKSGITGTVPRELQDMRNILKTSFKYPSYQLNNTIRLSVFGGEDAKALVFPNHYIRIIPKGESKSAGGLKLKAEIYEVKEGINEERFFSQGDLNLSGIKQETEGSHSRVFPVVSSAMLLTPSNWEAVGGVPVRVTSSGRVSGNSLSTSSFNSSTTSGQEKYLILGLRLEKVVK